MNLESYGMGSLHVLEGTMNAERYIKVLEQHAPLQMTCISAGQCKPHTAAITTAWLRSRRVRVLNWPACSPDLSPIENIWRIIKWKIHQRWPWTLQQLETYIRQEWDQIPTTKLQKHITSLPKKHPNISGIRVVYFLPMSLLRFWVWEHFSCVAVYAGSESSPI